MHHLERLAIVSAHPDLETRFTSVGIVDDPAHLETADLADQHAVLDDRVGTTRSDDRSEAIVVCERPAPAHATVRPRRAATCAARHATPRSGTRTRRPVGRARRCRCRPPRAVDRRPARSAHASEAPSRIDAGQSSRTQRGTQSQQGRTGSESDRFADGVVAEVLANQGAQLDADESAVPSSSRNRCGTSIVRPGHDRPDRYRFSRRSSRARRRSGRSRPSGWRASAPRRRRAGRSPGWRSSGRATRLRLDVPGSRSPAGQTDDVTTAAATFGGCDVEHHRRGAVGGHRAARRSSSSTDRFGPTGPGAAPRPLRVSSTRCGRHRLQQIAARAAK